MSVLLTEPARLAAHGLLHTVVSLDEDHDAIAFSRLNEVARLTLRIDVAPGQPATGQPAAWGLVRRHFDGRARLDGSVLPEVGWVFRARLPAARFLGKGSP